MKVWRPPTVYGNAQEFEVCHLENHRQRRKRASWSGFVTQMTQAGQPNSVVLDKCTTKLQPGVDQSKYRRPFEIRSLTRADWEILHFTHDVGTPGFEDTLILCLESGIHFRNFLRLWHCTFCQFRFF